MLLRPRRPKRLDPAPGRYHNLVILDLELPAPVEVFDRRFAEDGVFLEIDLLRAGFVVLDFGPRSPADWFFGEAEVEQAACGAGEEGGVLDCADGRDDVDGVFCGGKLLGEGVAGPAGADYCEGWFAHGLFVFSFLPQFRV